MIATLALLALHHDHCLVVDEDRILARHLSIRVSALSGVRADAMFGFAPRFGARRVIPGFELAAFARRNGVTIERPPDFCVTRPSVVIDPAQIQESLIAAVKTMAPKADVEVKVLDSNRQPTPPGQIEFPIEGLGHSDADSSSLWRGHVRDAAGHRFPIWARVQIWQMREVVVAREPISPSEPIRPEQLLVEKRRLGLKGEQPLSEIQEATGMVVTRPLRQGEVLTARQLSRQREIKPGETVSVEVESGRARLKLEAKAETAGRRGDKVMLKNLTSGKRFQAVVIGPGRAQVQGGIDVVPN